MRRVVTMVVRCAGAAALLTGAAACHVGPHSSAGAGESLDVCNGVRAYNALAEPVATSRASVQEYLTAAQRVFRRMDTTARYSSVNGPRRDVPAQVVTLVATERTALAKEAAALSDAGTAAQLRANEASFTSPGDYAAADTGLELWVSGNCG